MWTPTGSHFKRGYYEDILFASVRLLKVETCCLSTFLASLIDIFSETFEEIIFQKVEPLFSLSYAFVRFCTQKPTNTQFEANVDTYWFTFDTGLLWGRGFEFREAIESRNLLPLDISG